LWQYSRFAYYPRLTSDNAFQLFDIGYAAVASESLNKAYLRTGYDMPLALPITANTKRNVVPPSHNNTSTNSRPYLLQFRGAIQSTQHLGYHHRWMAAEYWDPNDSVKVDVKCVYKDWLLNQGGSRVTHDYVYPAQVYREWMEQSVFSFAPGGSGPGSYRFAEILSAGGIPVVTDDFVPPLYPEYDWSECLVAVATEHIVDFPRRLRLYTELEIKKRQNACARLLDTIVDMGNDYTDTRVMLTRALEIWALRVQYARKFADLKS